MRIVAADSKAQHLGIAAGLTLADARARVPGLGVLPYQPDADADLLVRIANGCERYTPMVALDPPATIQLDITGCTHRFRGGEEGLARDAARRLTRMGFTVAWRCAGTPDAASALAQYACHSVGELPVESLRMDAGTHAALRRAGLCNIADLSDRPLAPLAARFGEMLVRRLARLNGEDVRITPRRQPPEIVAEAHFAEPLTRSEDVLAVLADLGADVAAQLSTRDLGGRRFEAVLFRADGHVAWLGVDTASATRDMALIGRLFRERVDSLRDPLDPGFGYDLVRLGVPVLSVLAPQQLQLAGKADMNADLAALLDRLAIRLDSRRLHRFQPRDSHLPERAAILCPVHQRADDEWPSATRDDPPLRPLQLFDPPQPIEAVAEIPDGPPRQFRWRRQSHHVVRYEGPERIAAEWWRRKAGHNPGEGGLTRDYYRVEDAQGRRFWVFRHGLYADERTSPRWYLHGLFA